MDANAAANPLGVSVLPLSQERLRKIDRIVVSASRDNARALTYGEITNGGVQSIVDYVKSQDVPYITFIDLGCGRQGNMQLRNVRFIVRKSPVVQIVSISKVSKSVVACHPGGRGKSLSMAINNGFVHAKGVEVVDVRYADAIRSLETLGTKRKRVHTDLTR